jgi:GNAT superfamily N-acetyltransferase
MQNANLMHESMRIFTADSDEEIRKCFPAIKQLRPHLIEDRILSQVRRQMEGHGYGLTALEVNGTVEAVAGYRIMECLAWGKILYVDDLITLESGRGKGFGGKLIDWLFETGKEKGCAEIHLDSGVHRFDAHRLYLKKKMIISCHHFSKKVE